MSKKKHKKFKKDKKRTHVTYAPAITATNVTRPAVPQSAIEATETIAEPAETESVKDEFATLDAEYAPVRRGVRKVLLTIGLLVVLFIGAYFINTKTTLFASFGDWLYLIGNFQIQ